jgi:hypothetical protein
MHVFVEHCCEAMRQHLIKDELPISYVPKFREYGIDYPGSSSFQTIQFCPWCGTRLPESLRDAWFEELDRLGLDPDGQLPARLLTDSWWRDNAGR